MRRPTGRLLRLIGWIANCGRRAYSLAARIKPSPRIADAIHGGCPMLEVQCRHCNHAQTVDLADVIWPRERPIHTIRRALYCAKCEKGHGEKRRPDLTALRVRPSDASPTPAIAKRRDDL
jgi:hypothetical protein